MKSKITLLTLLLLVCTCTASHIARAQSYAIGESKYMKGDFAGAESSLQSAVGAAKNPKDKAKTLKLLGICQYMQGKKPASSTSFKQALASDPSITVKSDEVLDESVVGFFNAQKGAAVAKTPAKAATAKKQAASTPPPPPKLTAGLPQKNAKATHVKIVSNAPRGTVMLDGIMAGAIGSSLDADPGVMEIVVASPGYISKKAKIRVVKNQENTFTLNLDKIPPKVKPTPAPVAVAAAGAGATQVASGKDEGAGSTAKTKPLAKGAKGASAKGQKPVKDLFLPDGDDEVPAQQPQQMAQGQGQGGGKLSGRDVAGEFDQDAASGGYQAPPPQPYQMAPAPYPYQGYQPPPQPYQQPYPYGAYTPPQAAPVPATPAAPPAPPLPPAAPGQYDPGPAQGQQLAQTAVPDPAVRSTIRGPREKNLALSLLPFGIGQYQNHSYILGAAFTASELGALGFYFFKNQQADAMVQDVNDTLNNDTTSSADDKQRYADDSIAAVNTLRSQANYGLYAFAGLWAAGAIEAIVADPEPSGSAPIKKRRHRRSGFAILPNGGMALTYQLELP